MNDRLRAIDADLRDVRRALEGQVARVPAGPYRRRAFHAVVHRLSPPDAPSRIAISRPVRPEPTVGRAAEVIRGSVTQACVARMVNGRTPAGDGGAFVEDSLEDIGR